MSANTYALDALTRHQVYLQRYGGGIVNRLIPLLDTMRDDISTVLLRENLTDFQIARLNVIRLDVDQAIAAATGKIGANLADELKGLAQYEAGFTERLLNGMVSVEASTANIEALVGSLSDTPMELISGKKKVRLTIDQAVKQFTKRASVDVAAMIRNGIAQGQTTREIANTVSRTVNTRTKSQAEALIRTAANHAGSIARSRVYADNSDILDGEIFTATLDGKTTLECASNDGKIFAVGEGPQPALHFNCRSVRVPEVNKAFTLAKLSGERSSINGPVSNRNFSGWLRDQPESFQTEYFKQFRDGKERMQLFRQGGISIERFTDNNSIVYSLDELRALEPQAFERANL